MTNDFRALLVVVGLIGFYILVSRMIFAQRINVAGITSASDSDWDLAAPLLWIALCVVAYALGP